MSNKNYSLADIRPGRFQPRQQFDAEALLGLATSIRDQGLINPIIIFINEDSEPELIAGERRWRASCALALADRGELNMELEEAVSIVCQPTWPEAVGNYFFLSACWPRLEIVDGDDHQHLHQVSVVDNLQRADLSPVEEAHALQDLREEHGYSIRQLAEVVGKSKSWVDDRLQDD